MIVNRAMLIGLVMATVQGITIVITQCSMTANTMEILAKNDLHMLSYLLVHGVHPHCWVPWPLEQ